VFFQLSSRVRSLKSLGRPFCTVADRCGMPMLVQKWKNISCGQQRDHASTCHEGSKASRGASYRLLYVQGATGNAFIF
ncbi:unnamed protein product, partial [Musa textilis]